MGTCYSKRSGCYDLNSFNSTLPPPETPIALRRFSSLRQSLKTMTFSHHNRKSFRYKTVVKNSTNKNWYIIRYNETKECLV
ncbi:unnamed protein product [Didymodactylos carnosus]|uniref:Uncharacterized protein n=1 Tax=Didymodactylos carnosus TaxID=1234261 RepID=A0A814MSS7_9BILA|nr:unnamed protein product [Didymodactylos carnosus]CAF1082270.1 unnamed protein product [Didymodactylos carnosus]CAF3837865.1 unnamed protein product [Didymodactylos carnosus]CAF3848024.1 unnamed protein product [Didymodactylos carnosus]